MFASINSINSNTLLNIEIYVAICNENSLCVSIESDLFQHYIYSLALHPISFFIQTTFYLRISVRDAHVQFYIYITNLHRSQIPKMKKEAKKKNMSAHTRQKCCFSRWKRLVNFQIRMKSDDQRNLSWNTYIIYTFKALRLRDHRFFYLFRIYSFFFSLFSMFLLSRTFLRFFLLQKSFRENTHTISICFAIIFFFCFIFDVVDSVNLQKKKNLQQNRIYPAL